jgi:hypothetical protein
MEDLKSTYAKMGNEDLISIAFIHSDDYESEAVSIAKDELRKRGVGKRQETNLRTTIAKQNKPMPLPRSLKIFFVIAPGLCYWYMRLNPEKWKRTKGDALKFTLLGFGIWTILIGLVAVLAR